MRLGRALARWARMPTSGQPRCRGVAGTEVDRRLVDLVEDEDHVDVGEVVEPGDDVGREARRRRARSRLDGAPVVVDRLVRPPRTWPIASTVNRSIALTAGRPSARRQHVEDLLETLRRVGAAVELVERRARRAWRRRGRSASTSARCRHRRTRGAVADPVRAPAVVLGRRHRGDAAPRASRRCARCPARTSATGRGTRRCVWWVHMAHIVRPSGMERAWTAT